MGHVPEPESLRYSGEMTTATLVHRRARPRRALRDLAEVASNISVAVGVLFVLGVALNLRLGTPAGVGGFLSGLVLIAAGVAQISFPSRLRRARRAHAARAQAPELAVSRFVA